MRYLIGSKEDFFYFVNSITKKDKIGIITHTDLDGIASTILLEKILESKGIKIELINFVAYNKGMFDKSLEEFKNKKITKIFLTDMYADGGDLEGFEKLRKNFDCFLIDHHPIDSNFKNMKNVIKTETEDCSTLVLYNLAKECLDVSSWDLLVCATMVIEWSYKKKENIKFLQEKYPGLTLDNLDFSIPMKFGREIGSSLVYYRDNIRKVYDLVKKGDFSHIKEIYEEVEGEVKKAILKYNKEAEFYPKKNLYFAHFNTKFMLVSQISTILSKQDYNKTYIFGSDSENNIKFSARNQSGSEDVNILMKKAVSGLKNTSAGGHIMAAAATIKKEDLNRFKENLLG
jgi:single-stranded DNA-specific DHH superfamily exonuclease